jgi:hypothetical protein
MPPLLPVPNVLKIEFLGTNQGKNWANVMHAEWAGSSPFIADVLDVATQAYEAYESHFLPVIEENAVLQGCQVTDLSSNLGAQALYTESNAGGMTGPTFSAQVACVISWHVARRYRGGHPRTYLPPPEQTQIFDTSHWKDTFVSSALGAANSFMGAVNAITTTELTSVTLGQVSYVLNKARRDPPIFERFETVSVDSRIDTQRRRLGKH